MPLYLLEHTNCGQKNGLLAGLQSPAMRIIVIIGPEKRRSAHKMCSSRRMN